MSTNPRIALSERLASPGASSARWSASQKVIRSRWASPSMQASARSPIPRLGVFSTRRNETESAGLTSIRR